MKNPIATETPLPLSVRRSLEPPPTGPWERVRQRVVGFLGHLGEASEMAVGALRAGFRRPLEWSSFVAQLESLGVASVGIVLVTSLFIGMVMTVQFAYALEKFGAMEYVGRVVGLSFAWELAPTLTAVIVGGRIGAGMAAEVGSMAVTEQIDAIRALGADPLKKLVWPRLAAAVLIMPILAVLALTVGIASAMFITSVEFGIPASFFLESALDALRLPDFLRGVVKTPFFGAIIAIVGCHFGMTTKGGTAGVGNATTRTVVVTSITILIADFILTKLTLVIM